MSFIMRGRRWRGRLALVSAAAAVAVIAVSGCGGSGSAAGLTAVRIGLQPDFDYMVFPAAHELGLDRQQGLNFAISYYDQVGPEVQAMARGSVDMVSSCHSCDFAYYKSMPTLRDVIITDQFKGFIVVGRRGAPSYEKLTAAGQSAESARAAVYSYMKGRTFDIDKATFGALLNSMLAYAHLSASAVKVHDYSSDATAATAFLANAGDFYMGALPQEARLLLNFPDRATNMGGTGILGPAGLWYSTMATTQPWLASNHQVALKVLAISLRIAKILAVRPQQVIPIITSTLNEHSGSNFTNAQTSAQISSFISFTTLENGKNTVFNPNSSLFWQNSVNYYAAQDRASGILPAGANPATFNVDENLFKELLANQKLVSWINAPVSG